MGDGSSETLVEIGIVGKPHGVGGEIRIFLHNPDSTILQDVDSVHLERGADIQRCALTDIRAGNKCLLVRLAGVSTRAQAEAVKGSRVCVERSYLPPVDPGEFYIADLVGLEAFDGDTRLGRVTASRPQGGIEMVTVTGDGEALEIPLVEAFVVEVNISNGQIHFYDTDLLPRFKVKRGKR